MFAPVSTLVDLINMDEDLESIDIACNACENVFVFTVGEQRFFRDKGLSNHPKKCRSCRFARRAVRDQGTRNSSARGSSAPLPGAGYSLPIPTVPGLVLESDTKRFIAAVDDGRILQVRSVRELAPGTCVTFTRSTTKGDFLLHGVLDDSPPESARKACMKATVTEVGEDLITLRVHFNNAVLTCTPPSALDLEQGQRILFAVGWSDAGITAESITGLDPSKLPYSPGFAWKSPLGRPGVPTSSFMNIVHPSASLQLSTALGYTHDLCCKPELSPAPFAFADDSWNKAVPRLSLLKMEEMSSAGSWSQGSAPVGPESDSKVNKITTYLLRGTRSTGHLLAEYLRKNLSEIDSLGLERRVVVLYPVDECTTPANFLGTTSSRLFQSQMLPISKIEILSEPIPIAQACLSPVGMSGKITSTYMAAVHYEVSRGLVLPSLPPVTELHFSAEIPGSDAPLAPPDDPGPSSIVKFSIPKGALETKVLREALPRGTLLHSVGHAMAASYSTYEAAFATSNEAKEFVNVIGGANRSHKKSEHWLVAPLEEYWGGEQVFTMFTSKKFVKDEFYRLFNASWAFAVNHTQVRFRTDLTLNKICEIADKRNLKSRGLSFYRIFGDARGFINFDKRGGTVPIFPKAFAQRDSSPLVPPRQALQPAQKLITCLNNVPRSLSLQGIDGLVRSLAPEAKDISITQTQGLLRVSFSAGSQKAREELLSQPYRKMGKHFLYLSPGGGDSTESTTSHRCSGPVGLNALSVALSAGASAPTPNQDSKELTPPGLDPFTTSPPPDESDPTLPESKLTLEMSLRDRVSSKLAPHIPSSVSHRDDLLRLFLGDVSDARLEKVLIDQNSLQEMAIEVAGHLHDEIAGESGADSDNFDDSRSGRPYEQRSTDDTLVPKQQGTGLCEYYFAARDDAEREHSPDHGRRHKKTRTNDVY